MVVCVKCGHKIGFLEHTFNTEAGVMCAGCYEAAQREAAAKMHGAKLAPYLDAIHVNAPLPIVHVNGAIMKKDETAHAIAPTELKEIKTVNLGTSGVSHGVSIPLPIKVGGFPVRYRVGQSRGHIVKHDELKVTSSGHLIITDKRLFLNPIAANKPVSVPLSKIASYHVYENGLELWQDGKEKPLLFVLNVPDSEVFGICLSKLLDVGGSL